MTRKLTWAQALFIAMLVIVGETILLVTMLLLETTL
mgnify:CR=1 FL=1